MEKVYKEDKSYLQKQKKGSLTYFLFNLLMMIVLGVLIYSNFAVGEFFERLKYDGMVIMFLLAVFFAFVNYENWKELKNAEFFAELHIGQSEVVISTGMYHEKIDVIDIKSITHENKDKKDEHIAIELKSGQWFFIRGFERYLPIYNDLKAVWRG